MQGPSRAETFFSPEESRRIAEATRAVESRTVGEIAVVVVDSSSRYREAEVLGGVLAGGFIALAVTVVFFSASLWVYIPLSVALFFPAKYLFRKIPRLTIAFISHRRKEETVRQRAVRAFYEKGLYRTRQHTGVLFFFSLLERKVWVLADSGVNSKIGQETLDALARSVSQAVRDGRACEGLLEAMGTVGVFLERHFPITPGDIDELPNEVIPG